MTEKLNFYEEYKRGLRNSEVNLIQDMKDAGSMRIFGWLLMVVGGVAMASAILVEKSVRQPLSKTLLNTPTHLLSGSMMVGGTSLIGLGFVAESIGRGALGVIKEVQRELRQQHT